MSSQPPRRIDFVAGEFAPHNLPLQALLGVLGFGARVEGLLAALPAGDEPRCEAATHSLDLALLGLLGLDASLRAGLHARGLGPSEVEARSEPQATEPSEAPKLRELLR